MLHFGLASLCVKGGRNALFNLSFFLGSVNFGFVSTSTSYICGLRQFSVDLDNYQMTTTYKHNKLYIMQYTLQTSICPLFSLLHCQYQDFEVISKGGRQWVIKTTWFKTDYAIGMVLKYLHKIIWLPATSSSFTPITGLYFK